MIYTPSKNPKEAFITITIMVVAGLAGGYLISVYFMIVALLFWMQYTAVLSYLQFKRKSKHTRKTFTDYLLHPQLRFFLFEFIATLGIGSLFTIGTKHIAASTLIAWWLFSLNFYRYYSTSKAAKRVTES